MAGSLCKKGEYHPKLKEYGLVIVDECHHSASSTISAVLREVNAKHIILDNKKKSDKSDFFGNGSKPFHNSGGATQI